MLGARTSPRYSLMLLITDGEEHGLMGARALMQDPEVRARLKTFINLEAIGTDEALALRGRAAVANAFATAPECVYSGQRISNGFWNRWNFPISQPLC